MVCISGPFLDIVSSIIWLLIGCLLGRWIRQTQETWGDGYIWIWRFMIAWKWHPGLWIGFYDKHRERAIWGREIY